MLVTLDAALPAPQNRTYPGGSMTHVSHEQPHNQPHAQPHHGDVTQFEGYLALLPQRQPRDLASNVVAGWVVAEITPYPCRLRVLEHIYQSGAPVGESAVQVSPSPTKVDAAKTEVAAELVLPRYAAPEAQFVLAVVEYPHGSASQWGALRWCGIEIVLRSEQSWTVALGEGGAPQPTPELEQLVDELAQQAQALGWEDAGSGKTWCSRRFRQRGDQLEGHLRGM